MYSQIEQYILNTCLTPNLFPIIIGLHTISVTQNFHYVLIQFSFDDVRLLLSF